MKILMRSAVIFLDTYLQSSNAVKMILCSGVRLLGCPVPPRDKKDRKNRRKNHVELIL